MSMQYNLGAYNGAEPVARRERQAIYDYTEYWRGNVENGHWEDLEGDGK
jgi:hypothetical protein